MSEDASPPGRRDRRKAVVRRRLLEAARQAIAQNGVADLRISGITERADLGFGTFYTYFASKDELIEAVASEVLEGLASTIGADALAFDDPAEAVAASYRRFLRFSRDEHELASALIELDGSGAMFESAVRPWAKETLLRGNASGRFRIDDIDFCLISIVGASLSAIRAILQSRVCLENGTESYAAEMLLRALGVDEATAHDVSRRELSK